MMVVELVLECAACDAVMQTADPVLQRQHEADHADCPLQDRWEWEAD